MNTESIQPAREVISGFLKSRREELGLSGEELARRVGVTGSTIWKVERSRIWPKLDLLLKICEQLECDFSFKRKACQKD